MIGGTLEMFDASENGRHFQINTFGGFSLENVSKYTPSLVNRKACALLVYLALSDSGSESRERLSALLWSNSDEQQARASLRQCLKQIREFLNTDKISVIHTGRSDIKLDHSKLSVDVHEVIYAVESGTTHPILLQRKLLTETFLPSFEDLDPEYRIWLLVQRQSIHERIVRALEDAMVLNAERFEMKAAKPFAIALLNLDPSHETACQYLMRIHAMDGEIPSALKIYKTLWELLDKDYDMEPAQKTQDVVVAIKLGKISASNDNQVIENTFPTSATSSLPTLKVLDTSPLENTINIRPKIAILVKDLNTNSLSGENINICEGFRMDLISRLVQFREWSVIDERNISEDIQEYELSRPEIFKLDIRFFQNRDALNMVLTVMSAKTGEYVWSDQFAITFDEFFACQKEVMRRIASVLNVNLSMNRLNNLAGKPDVSLDVFDRWLWGQRLGLRWRPDNDQRAEQIFRSIIEEAPHFSPAYSSLAGVLNSRHHTFPGILRDVQRENDALKYARKAVENDPIDTRSQLSLAWAHTMAGNYDNAGDHFLMAYDLNKSDAWTAVSVALGMAYVDDKAKALDVLEQAIDLGPANTSSHWGYHANVRFICEEYEECIRVANFAEDSIFYVSGWKAAAYAQLGKVDEAQKAAGHFNRIIADNWHGKKPATQVNISEWFLGAFPIRNQQTFERLRIGFLSAISSDVESIANYLQ